MDTDSTDFNQDNINPSQELRNLLKIIFPLKANEDNSFIKELDEALKAEGEFLEITYESTINYLFRRILFTADFIYRKCKHEIAEYNSENSTFSENELFIDELRTFLRDKISLEGNNREKVLSLTCMCLDNRKKNRTKKRKKKKSRRSNLIRSQTLETGDLFCYICGRSLTTEEGDIEHIWSRSMGGSDKEDNLKISCQDCNQYKEDYIDYSDFHYEEICLANHEKDCTFHTSFKRLYKIATWSKSNYSCILCGAKAEEVGKLNLVRRDNKDSWHFLNIDAMCQDCSDLEE
jgi:5-methylcytosine-specific restriction endonuclease McrA